jgi:ribosomal protein S13
MEESDIKTTSKQKRHRFYKENIEIRDYEKNAKSILTTTRFNDETWEQNEEYRDKNKLSGCIYGTPEPISSKISRDKLIFVLEMNNEKNRIMGIGMIKNNMYVKKHRIYNNDDYNRYSYLGKYRVDRDDMTKEEEDIMKVFDVLCFRGARHQKRLKGIKSFPLDMLFNCSKIMDLVDFISKMFKKRIENKMNKLEI